MIRWSFKPTPIKKQMLSILIPMTAAAALYLGAGFRPDAASSSRADNRSDLLEQILEAGAGYCNLLAETEFDFTCRENIRERSYYARGGRLFFKEKKQVFQYRMKKNNGRIHEERTPLSPDGQGPAEPGTMVETASIAFRFAVLRPQDILGKDAQSQHDYKIALEDATWSGKDAVVIEAVPKPGRPAEHMYGRIWLQKQDFTLLKIDWEPASLENYDLISEMMLSQGLKPEFVITSEFNFEYRGIRFPSRFLLKQYFVTDSGRKQLFKEMRADYNSYSFDLMEIRPPQYGCCAILFTPGCFDDLIMFCISLLEAQRILR